MVHTRFFDAVTLGSSASRQTLSASHSSSIFHADRASVLVVTRSNTMGNKYHNSIVESTALHHDYDDLKLLTYLRTLGRLLISLAFAKHRSFIVL